MTYAQRPSCLLQCCPPFQHTKSMDIRSHISHTDIATVGTKIKMLSFSCQHENKQTNKKASQQIQQSNPHCALSCVCCRAHIPCTTTSALDIAACIVRGLMLLLQSPK